MGERSGRSAAALEIQRQSVRPLLNLNTPVDAIYAYYTLYHDPKRTQLYLHGDSTGRTRGFVAVCQTGRQLFQPTVVLRTPDARGAVDLLRQALVPGRPYFAITTPDLRDAVTEVLSIDEPRTNCLYRLDLSAFESAINVLVVAEQGLGGLPRFVIRSHEEVAAEAGLNWSSPYFAEVCVHTHPGAQGRGWGQAVVTACTRWVIHAGRQPLYVTDEGNRPSRGLAEAVGYVDTGVREFAGEGVGRPRLGGQDDER